MVFNTDFALQLARDHQASLRRAGGTRLERLRPRAARERIGAWIVRLGQAVEGQAAARQNRAWQG